MEKFYFGKGVLPSFFDELIDRCFGNPLTSDPDTTEWSAAEAGYGWFNTTEGIPKFWTGTCVSVLNLSQPSDYYVFIDAEGYTTAHNKQTGEYEFHELVPELAINQAIYHLAENGGGNISFSGQLFRLLHGPIIGRHRVSLLGKGAGFGGVGAATTVFQTAGAFNAFETPSSDSLWGVQLKNICLDGNSVGAKGIALLTDFYFGRFENIWVRRFTGEGIHFGVNAGDLQYMNLCHHINITNCQKGIVYDNSSPNNYAIFGRIRWVERGVEVKAGNQLIQSLIIEGTADPATTEGVYIDGANSCRIWANRIEGDVACGGTGVKINSGNYNDLSGNHIVGGWTDPVIDSGIGTRGADITSLFFGFPPDPRIGVNLGNSFVSRIDDAGNGYQSFQIPPDVNRVLKAEAIIVPSFTNAATSIKFYSQAATCGEAYNLHLKNLEALTFDLTANQISCLDLSTLLSLTEKGDVIGIRVNNNCGLGAGNYLYWYGTRLKVFRGN